MPGVSHWLVTALALAAMGCNPAPGSSSQDGRTLYQAVCASCHGSDGKPPEAMAARLGVRDLSAGEFRARVDQLGPALVAKQVREGSKSKLMPSFAGVLDEAQVTAVAAFVASSQFGQPPQPPQPWPPEPFRPERSGPPGAPR
jgi:mono/diheme cytochrome c family protein